MRDLGHPSFVGVFTSRDPGHPPDVNNRLASLNPDAAGDAQTDAHGNTLTYDAEGRIHSVNGSTVYVYNAEGIRVAKENGSGGVLASYVLGPGGVQLVEMNGSGQWQHSNIYAMGHLLATYDSDGTRFHLEDALGSRRIQARTDGTVGLTCFNYAFGDGLNCTGSDEDATEHHYTGKERDAESGNDYFGARYYTSDLGRFLIPDWSAKAEPVPYAKLDNPQTLNLYSYVQNNPITLVDPDGHISEQAEMSEVEKNNHSMDTAEDKYAVSLPQPKAPEDSAQQQSPQVQSLVNAQNAAMTNGKYQPDTPTAGTTHCSEAACAVAKGTGANLTGILYDSRGNNYDANTQINNLANSPNYHVVTPDQAQALGNKGVLVFGTQHGARHGHIATVRPEGIPGDNPRGRSGPLLANVGLFNGVAHQSAVMTPAHGAIVYYAPNE